MPAKFLKSVAAAALLLIAAASLSSCGQKGPLYLPQPSKPAAPAP